MKKLIMYFIVLSLFFVACQTDSDEIIDLESSLKEITVKPPTFIDLGNTSNSFSSKLKSGEKMEIIAYMAEYITAENSENIGNTVFFNNRGNKQLGADFVANPFYLDFTDGTNDITYYVDSNRPPTGINFSVSDAAIGRAMNTWDEVTCSDLGITKIASDGRDTGFFAWLFGFGPYVDPITGWAADVLQAGWMPPAFFDVLAPGGSNFILGVTFTLVVAVDGVIIDEDNNGKPDVWTREIYYNDNFPWSDGNNIDIETVALHESGHGLSQAHFGKAFASGNFKQEKNIKVHFSPRAVMNASYSGIQTSIEKTDKAGNCSIWADWPNN